MPIGDHCCNNPTLKIRIYGCLPPASLKLRVTPPPSGNTMLSVFEHICSRCLRILLTDMNVLTQLLHTYKFQIYNRLQINTNSSRSSCSLLLLLATSLANPCFYLAEIGAPSRESFQRACHLHIALALLFFRTLAAFQLHVNICV